MSSSYLLEKELIEIRNSVKLLSAQYSKRLHLLVNYSGGYKIVGDVRYSLYGVGGHAFCRISEGLVVQRGTRISIINDEGKIVREFDIGTTPRHVDFNDDESKFIVSIGSEIREYSYPDFTLLRSITGLGTVYMCKYVDEDNIILSDFTRHVVEIRSLIDGTVSWSWGEENTPGHSDTLLNGPWAVDISGKFVLIGDYRGHRVLVVDKDANTIAGIYLAPFPEHSSFDLARRIAIGNQILTYMVQTDGRVLWTAPGNWRAIFTKYGTLILSNAIEIIEVYPSYFVSTPVPHGSTMILDGVTVEAGESIGPPMSYKGTVTATHPATVMPIPIFGHRKVKIIAKINFPYRLDVLEPNHRWSAAPTVKWRDWWIIDTYSSDTAGTLKIILDEPLSFLSFRITNNGSNAGTIYMWVVW